MKPIVIKHNDEQWAYWLPKGELGFLWGKWTDISDYHKGNLIPSLDDCQYCDGIGNFLVGGKHGTLKSADCNSCNGSGKILRPIEEPEIISVKDVMNAIPSGEGAIMEFAEWQYDNVKPDGYILRAKLKELK